MNASVAIVKNRTSITLQANHDPGTMVNISPNSDYTFQSITDDNLFWVGHQLGAIADIRTNTSAGTSKFYGDPPLPPYHICLPSTQAPFEIVVTETSSPCVCPGGGNGGNGDNGGNGGMRWKQLVASVPPMMKNYMWIYIMILIGLGLLVGIGAGIGIGSRVWRRK